MSDEKEIGHAINPCGARGEKTINNKQHDIAWRVDNMKSVPTNPKVNYDFSI